MTTISMRAPSSEAASVPEAIPADPPARLASARVAGSGDMVPLTERIGFMQLVRLGCALLAAAATVALPGAAAQRGALLVATAGYLAVAGIAELFWRLYGQRGLTLFGVLLLVDGAYLAWLTQLSGGMSSPLRFLVVVYAVATTLLASYRTGLKSTLWSSITLYVVYRANGGDWLPHSIELTGDEALSGLFTVIVLLWTVALATAVFSSVNERELRRRRYDLQALTLLARQLEAETSPEQVAATALAALAETYRIERAVLVRVGPQGLGLLAAYPQNAAAAIVDGECGLLWTCATSTEPLLLARLDSADAGPLADLLPDARNVIVLPLNDEAGFTGAVVCERGQADRGRLDRRTLAMMQQFTAHAALALRRAALLDELRRRADYDGLTGVANRRTFDETLARELARAERTGSQVSLLLIDIDHFKALNDTHGHQQGDAVLRELGALLTEQARPFDTSARYGGEEFAVILPDCPTDQATTVAERLRVAIAAGITTVPITVSIGVAGHPTEAGTPTASTAAQLIHAADMALYIAKRNGRNLVHAAASVGDLS